MKALDDLSFGVERGQIFCLLGPNGAGKTTSFNVITGKLPPTSGKLQEREKKITSVMDGTFTTGICQQTNTLWNYMTVKQHLQVYADLRGMQNVQAAESIDFLLSTLDLEKHANKKIRQLSGGTKRKLCVALAVIGEPDMILLDEPTTGVDPIGRDQIRTLLKSLAKNNSSSVIFSTHSMDDAEYLADKLGNFY